MKRLQVKIPIHKLFKYLNKEAKFSYNFKNIFFDNVSTLEQANSHSIVWVDASKEKNKKLIEKTNSKIIIVDKSYVPNKDILSEKCIIFVKNPRLTFVKILNYFFESPQKYEIHETAIIHPEAKLSKNVNIGEYAVIGKCEIGDKTNIQSFCNIENNSKIGRNVFIDSGSKIGTKGFGYVKNNDNSYISFPHYGSVIIRDNVEIGANSCIDRGTLGDTIIGKGVKIDNLVHVAHNVNIGENSIIVAHTLIAGSSIIGKNSWIATSIIRDGINIGENSFIGLGSVVTKDVPPFRLVVGNPAKIISKIDKSGNKVP